MVHDSGRCLGWASKSLLPQTILGFCYKTVFCKEKVTNSPAGKRGRGEQRNVPNIILSIVCTGPAFLDSIGYSPEAGARSCCSKCRIRKGAGAAGVHGLLKGEQNPQGDSGRALGSFIFCVGRGTKALNSKCWCQELAGQEVLHSLSAPALCCIPWVTLVTHHPKAVPSPSSMPSRNNKSRNKQAGV